MNFLTILFFAYFMQANAHPIHIAVSEVQYAEDIHALQVMHKIFIDDFEDHIERIEAEQGNTVDLKLATKKELPEADDYIKKYIVNHFQIYADGKQYFGNYLGKEYETDAVWIYIEIEDVPRPKQVKIKNTILVDFHSDQSNFIHFNIANQKKSLRYYRGETTQTVNFK